MHSGGIIRDEDGNLAYECGACGASSSSPADVVLGVCRICGLSEAEVQRHLAHALEEHGQRERDHERAA